MFFMKSSNVCWRWGEPLATNFQCFASRKVCHFSKLYCFKKGLIMPFIQMNVRILSCLVRFLNNFLHLRRFFLQLHLVLVYWKCSECFSLLKHQQPKYLVNFMLLFAKFLILLAEASPAWSKINMWYRQRTEKMILKENNNILILIIYYRYLRRGS